MLPEIETYLAADEAAEKIYHTAIREAENGYYDLPREVRCDEKYGEMQQARNVAFDVYNVAHNTAWNELTKSSDPLVRFIAEHCKEYRNEAQEILKVLPVKGIEELEMVAANHDWCSIWNQFLDKAMAAGVVPGYRPPTEERKALIDWIRDNLRYSISGSQISTINQLVTTIVASETKITETTELTEDVTVIG